MKPVGPFVNASRPDDAAMRKVGVDHKKHQEEKEGKANGSGGDAAPKCPFGYDAKKEPAGDAAPKCPFGFDAKKEPAGDAAPKCPFGFDAKKEPAGDAAPKCPFGFDAKKESDGDSGIVSPKCPYGYDSPTVKLGPLSCMICKALLFDCSKCVPCSHVYCKVCISRFNDCPLCGIDIEKIEDDTIIQSMVDRFIEGHVRIKRPEVETDKADKVEVENDMKTVIYEDVSMKRGAFLVQQAMRAFHAKNIESAKSRLSICAEDTRYQLERVGSTPELCSQLGAVSGMLGDCCRAMGDPDSAVTYFEESVGFLSKFPSDDLEVTHTLSVSLNKIGDLKYHEDLQAARSYYSRSLNVRRDSAKCHPNVPSQVLDVAVSLAKVADLDRILGDEDVAVDGFKEAITLLDSLTLKPEEAGLDQRRNTVLEFLNSQLTAK